MVAQLAVQRYTGDEADRWVMSILQCLVIMCKEKSMQPNHEALGHPGHGRRRGVRNLVAIAAVMTLGACEANRLTNAGTPSGPRFSFDTVGYCLSGGDDFEGDAHFTDASRCLSGGTFGVADTLSVKLVDASFDVTPDTINRQQVYAVFAHYVYGHGYRYDGGTSEGVNAGYRLVAWKVLPNTATSLDSIRIKVDLPQYADVVVLQGYIGSCPANPASDSACAYASVIGGTSHGHDEPALCIPNTGVSSALTTCAGFTSAPNLGIPWPNGSSYSYVNYPPRASFTSYSDSVSACFGGLCPTLYRQWTLDPSASSDPENGAMSGVFEDLYGFHITHSVVVSKTSSGILSDFEDYTIAPNATTANWRLSISDGFTKHTIDRAIGPCNLFAYCYY